MVYDFPHLSSNLSSSSFALDATVFTADDTLVSTALLLSNLTESFSGGADGAFVGVTVVVVIATVAVDVGFVLFKCPVLSFDGAFDAVGLFANDVTISVFTPFTVFTMLVQLVFDAEDVVGAVAVVCAWFPLLLGLVAVPSAGNAFGELELVVFVAAPSVCSLNGSSFLSLSTSVLLLLLSLSAVFVCAVVDSLSFTLFVVVVAATEKI